MTNRPARVLWATMYLIVGSTLLWFRLLRPILQALRHQLRVTEVCWESNDTVSVWITGRNLHDLGAEPGQFFRWRFLTRELWWAANPYSLSAPPTSDSLRITVKHAGEHSRGLLQLTPGTRVVAEGPFGAFTAARRRKRRVLLLAGGVGITPIRALFESMPGNPGDITLVYRARDSEDVMFAEELDQIARARGARVHYVLGSRGQGQRKDPLTAARLQQLVPDLRGRDIYLCGPPGMTDHARAELRHAKVPRNQIHFESFTF